MNKINLSAYQPIVDIQDNIVFANNGNVVLCYQGNLPEIYSLSEKDFEDLHGAWFQAFKSLPVGTVIHKQDIYLKKSYSAEQLPNRTFLEKATNEHFKGRGYIEHQCYLFFILTKNKALNNPKYVNPFRKASKSTVHEMNNNLKSFSNAVNDSVSFINNSRRVSLKPLNGSEIMQLTQNYFNGFSEGFDTDIVLEKKNVSIGNHLFDVLPSTANCALAKVCRVARPMRNSLQTISYFTRGGLLMV